MQNVASVDPVLRSLEKGSPLGEFAVAHASGDSVSRMLLDCLGQLECAPEQATLGLVYLSSSLIDEFDSLLEQLQRAMPRVNWIGATVDTVMAGCAEHRDAPAMALMVGDVAVDQFRILAGVRKSLSGRLASIQGWRRRNGTSGALVHGDAANPMTPDMIGELGQYLGKLPLIGGLMGRRQPGLQVAVSVISGGVSGVLFGRDIDVFSGRALGCSPVGLPRVITRMAGGEIFEIDNRPALDVLFEEAGELLSRDLDRLMNYICPAFAAGEGAIEYLPAEFLAIDPVRRSFKVGESIALSGELRFYRRDGDAAWRHFDDMLLQAVERTRGRTIRAGVSFR